MQSATLKLTEQFRKQTRLPCPDWVLQSWVGQARGPPHRFRMNRLPFTQGSFYMLARLVLGKLLVNRSDAIHRFPPVFGEFGRTWYGKRACPCCFLEHGIFVLDSEWHWVFDHGERLR